MICGIINHTLNGKVQHWYLVTYSFQPSSFPEMYQNTNLCKCYHNRCSRFCENEERLLNVCYVLWGVFTKSLPDGKLFVNSTKDFLFSQTKTFIRLIDTRYLFSIHQASVQITTCDKLISIS